MWGMAAGAQEERKVTVNRGGKRTSPRRPDGYKVKNVTPRKREKEVKRCHARRQHDTRLRAVRQRVNSGYSRDNRGSIRLDVYRVEGFEKNN